MDKLRIEEIEYHDWHVTNLTGNEERRSKSISSYYLDQWYPRIETITFKTHIYPINNSIDEACPEVLPFEKCMVRYENKSPKDSEYWGPVKTKEEIINVFYTSLRCKTNKGKFLCIREWCDSIEKEYRCFWNCKLVACAIDSDMLDKSECDDLIAYIKSIEKLIPYMRCVFDIAKIKLDRSMRSTCDLATRPEFKLVEFNSWETNSGAHTFDWIADTEILYPDYLLEKYDIVFRSNCSEIKYTINLDNQPKETIDTSKIKIYKPNKPSNWLVTDNYVYIATDIWLGRFTLDLKILNWKRGVYRFTNIQLCKDGSIYIGNEHFHYDLTKLKTKPSIDNDYFAKNINNYSETASNRYGFYCEFDNKFQFCELTNSGQFRMSAT